jgi:hypothetical protein
MMNNLRLRFPALNVNPQVMMSSQGHRIQKSSFQELNKAVGILPIEIGIAIDIEYKVASGNSMSISIPMKRRPSNRWRRDRLTPSANRAIQ